MYFEELFSIKVDQAAITINQPTQSEIFIYAYFNYMSFP
jgi:hypothetical protein